jgi:NitT/TauT family transport system permease protein
MLKSRALSLQLASLALFLLIWEVAALVMADQILPGPMAVFGTLFEEALQGELLYHLAITLTRVAIAFLLAMVFGTVIGIAMGRVKVLDHLFDSWLVLFLNIPALVVIILAYVWFGLIEAAAVLAVTINKIPNVVVTMREGARALDTGYLDMAKVYRYSRFETMRHVILPQLYPYLMASARSGLALIWKIVLVVELLGRSNGMGFQLHLFFQLFDVQRILAYTVAFVLVIHVIELLILKPLERHANRWR